MNVITDTNFADLTIFKKGKVRDVYDFDDKLLIVATDRISAFDIVLPTLIPEKGKIITRICEAWFNMTKHIIKNHLITTKVDEFPAETQRHSEILEGRSMLVQKAKLIPVECVVRGWLAGSAWKEYREKGTVCGIKLPNGLVEASKLKEPIFTPTTKAEQGHDIPLTQAGLQDIVGQEPARIMKLKSIELYKFATGCAKKRGIIIADTKLEFGWIDDEIILIDELFTPDSSRYWPITDYKPGRTPKSFDKQFVRDYLEEIGWNKKPPAPELPFDIVNRTKEKYLEAERLILNT